MPGLRNHQAGMMISGTSPYNTMTTTTAPYYIDMHHVQSSAQHHHHHHYHQQQQSYNEHETLSHFKRPSSRKQSIPRPAPQWLQLGKEDMRYNSLRTSQWSDVVAPQVSCHGGGGSIMNNDSDDLQALVHEFIENDCEYMDGSDADFASPPMKLTDHLQMLTTPSSCIEREVLADVRVLLLTNNETTDLICDVGDSECKGGCTKRFLVKHLKVAGYSASICQSKWLSTVGVPGGEYEYIDVVFNGDHPDRLIVDIDFQAQFQIARPTQQYKAALKTLPTIFVGTASRLEQILKLMSEAGKLSLVQNNMHLPPWRTLEYMSAKWLSPNFERKSTNAVSSSSTPFNGPCSLHWRSDTKTSTPTLESAKPCGDLLRCIKVSLLAEVSGSAGLIMANLPRGRSSRSNLLLRPYI